MPASAHSRGTERSKRVVKRPLEWIKRHATRVAQIEIERDPSQPGYATLRVELESGDELVGREVGLLGLLAFLEDLRALRGKPVVLDRARAAVGDGAWRAFFGEEQAMDVLRALERHGQSVTEAQARVLLAIGRAGGQSWANISFARGGGLFVDSVMANRTIDDTSVASLLSNQWPDALADAMERAGFVWRSATRGGTARLPVAPPTRARENPVRRRSRR